MLCRHYVRLRLSRHVQPRRPYSGAIFGAVHGVCSDRGDQRELDAWWLGLHSIWRGLSAEPWNSGSTVPPQARWSI